MNVGILQQQQSGFSEPVKTAVLYICTVYSVQCTVFSAYRTQWLLKCCAIRMTLNITPDQVKLLYSEAGKPLEYVDQKFSYDFEVEVTENVGEGMLDSLHRMGANFQLSEFQVKS